MTVMDEGRWPGDRRIDVEAAPRAEGQAAAEPDALIDDEPPPPRVWLAIADQLRAEGLIR